MRALMTTWVSRTTSTSAPSLGSAPHFRDRFPNLLLDRLVRNVLVLFPVLLDELQDTAPRAFDRLIALGRDDDGHDLAGALDDDLASRADTLRFTAIPPLYQLIQVYQSCQFLANPPPRPPEAAPSALGGPAGAPRGRTPKATRWMQLARLQFEDGNGHVADVVLPNQYQVAAL